MNNTNSKKGLVISIVVAVIVIIAGAAYLKMDKPTGAMQAEQSMQADEAAMNATSSTATNTLMIPAGWQQYSYPNLGFELNYYKGAIEYTGNSGIALIATSDEQYHLVAASEPIYRVDITTSNACEKADDAIATSTVINGTPFLKTDVTTGYSGMNSLQYVNSYCADHSGSKVIIDVRVWPKDRSDAEKQKSFQEIDDFMNKLDFTFTN